MLKNNAVTTFILIGLSLAVGACVGKSPRENLSAPQYATPSGTQWVVDCPLARISLDQYRLEQFYRDDGIAKTREEFCGEDRTSSAIKRRTQNP